MWPDDNGGWFDPAQWVDPTGTTPQNGSQVQANDVLTQSTVTNGPDRWGGWLTSLVDKGVNYALQRDAAKSGLVQTTTPNGQPVYRTAAPAANNGNGLLFIGMAVVIGLLMASNGSKG